jgi:tRNA(fMet)-specific endonuclease VapC
VRFLLDTDTFSVAARDPYSRVQAKLASIPMNDIGISAITAGEIEFGLAKKLPGPVIASRVAAMRVAFRVLAVDEGVARRYGHLRDELRKSGTPIGPNDLWIAAHALSLNLTLVSNNTREFRRVPELKLENWLT